MLLTDGFKLTGNFNQKSKKIGKMGPTINMKAISGSIYEKVLKPY